MAKTNFFSCVNQAAKHITMHYLVRSGPGLSRLSGFGFGTLLHNLRLWKLREYIQNDFGSLVNLDVVSTLLSGSLLGIEPMNTGFADAP
ncbi:hypothetical protein [Granulicella sibirica]|uniref:hypothetical protein n=1 Tax=Granulicella sibirica TaxID=2479048 RepID=UPI001F4F2441|nr:hypothetical protein [Granulicella sibirica]